MNPFRRTRPTFLKLYVGPEDDSSPETEKAPQMKVAKVKLTITPNSEVAKRHLSLQKEGEEPQVYDMGSLLVHTFDLGPNAKLTAKTTVFDKDGKPAVSQELVIQTGNLEDTLGVDPQVTVDPPLLQPDTLSYEVVDVVEVPEAPAKVETTAATVVEQGAASDAQAQAATTV